MLRFGKTKLIKEPFDGAKELIDIWNVNVVNKTISESFKKKPNSKYLIGYLEKAIRSEMSIYVKAFKVKNGDKGKNNKLIFFGKDDENILEKYRVMSTKIEDLRVLN